MDATHGSTAVARTDHGVEVLVLVVSYAVVVVQADTTHHSCLIRYLWHRWFLLLHIKLFICHTIVGHFRFGTLLLCRTCFQIFDCLDVQAIKKAWRPNQLDAAIQALFIQPDVLAQIDVVGVNNWVFRPTSHRADGRLVALRPLRSRTLAPLRLQLRLWWLLGFWIVNISHSQPDPTHPYYRVFEQFEPLGLIGLFWIFVDDVPKFFLRVGIYLLQIDLIFVKDPVPFLYPLLLFGFLVHYPADLSWFLLFFVQIHSFRIWALHDVRVLGCQSDQYLLLLLQPWPAQFAILLDNLFMPDHLGVSGRYNKIIFNHHIRIMVVEQPERIFAPCFGVNFKTILMQRI